MTATIHNIRKLEDRWLEVDFECEGEYFTGRFRRAGNGGLGFEMSDAMWNIPGLMSKYVVGVVADFEDGKPIVFPVTVADGV